nr:ribonuclease H-like domain-containing protein [Tanacetum cinerariifolium]
MAITTKDMQKRKNDVKARTTLLLALPDEHQLRFNKYDPAKEFWEAILKTFGGNEVTKKTKKNQLKQQYGNFKAEGSETLEQTFNRLQAIVSHLKFMDVPIEQDDLDQNLLTSLALEWLVTDVAAAIRIYETVCAFIATQPSGSQIKYEDISQIDNDDIEEMDIKWNLALLSMMADRWDWSYMAEEDEASKNHALMADEEEVPTEYALMAKSSSSSDNEKMKLNTMKKLESLREIQILKIIKRNISGMNLRRLLGSQKLDKDIKGVGFNEYYAVLPLPVQVYSPPKKDLSWMGLPEFIDDNVTDYTRPTPSIDVSNSFNCNHDTWVDKWKTWTSVNHAQDNMKYISTHKSMTPKVVLLKSGTKPINRPFSTAKPTLKSAQPKMKSFVKTSHSNVKGPFERKLAAKNKVWSPTVRPKTPTIGSKVPTAKPTVAADKGNKGKAIKALARWIWKPKQNSSGQGLNFNGVSVTFEKYQYIDIQDRLKSMRLHFQHEMSDMRRLSLLTLAWICQDRENIAKTYVIPYEALPKVPSLGGGEGKEERRLYLRGCSKHEEIDQGEDLLDRDKSVDKGSDSTDEMSHVLGTLRATNILASRGLRSVLTTASLSVATASISVSPAVATASESFPTTSIFTTASVATHTTRVTRSSRGVVIGSSS